MICWFSKCDFWIPGKICDRPMWIFVWKHFNTKKVITKKFGFFSDFPKKVSTFSIEGNPYRNFYKETGSNPYRISRKFSVMDFFPPMSIANFPRNPKITLRKPCDEFKTTKNSKSKICPQMEQTPMISSTSSLGALLSRPPTSCL